MKNVLKNGSRLSKVSGHLSLFPIGSLSFLMMLLVMLSSCGTNTGNTVNTDQVSPPPASFAKGYPINVYFPQRDTHGLESETKIFPVQRMSPNKAVATTALQLLIAGPTAVERKAGYYSDLGGMLQGPSTCGSSHGGPDFRLTLDRRGKFVEAGTATVQFCRQLGAYWNHIEPEPGSFSTDELDWQVDAAEQADKQIILCIGPTQNLWLSRVLCPHSPPQAAIPGTYPHSAIRVLLAALSCDRIHHASCGAQRKSIIAWQLEHEAADPLGIEHSWRLAVPFIEKELEALRKVDLARPIILPIWLAASPPDFSSMPLSIRPALCPSR